MMSVPFSLPTAAIVGSNPDGVRGLAFVGFDVVDFTE